MRISKKSTKLILFLLLFTSRNAYCADNKDQSKDANFLTSFRLNGVEQESIGLILKYNVASTSLGILYSGVSFGTKQTERNGHSFEYGLTSSFVNNFNETVASHFETTAGILTVKNKALFFGSIANSLWTRVISNSFIGIGISTKFFSSHYALYFGNNTNTVFSVVPHFEFISSFLGIR